MERKETKRRRRAGVLGWRLVLASLAAIPMVSPAGTALAQIRPPIPPPLPFTEDCLRMMRIIREWSDENPEVRERASAEARPIVRAERMRLLQQAIDDMGQGPPPPPREDVEARVQELLEESCVYQVLRAALKSADGEVRARSKTGLRGFAPPAPKPKKDPPDEEERRERAGRVLGVTAAAVDEILSGQDGVATFRGAPGGDELGGANLGLADLAAPYHQGTRNRTGELRDTSRDGLVPAPIFPPFLLNQGSLATVPNATRVNSQSPRPPQTGATSGSGPQAPAPQPRPGFTPSR